MEEFGADCANFTNNLIYGYAQTQLPDNLTKNVPVTADFASRAGRSLGQATGLVQGLAEMAGGAAAIVAGGGGEALSGGLATPLAVPVVVGGAALAVKGAYTTAQAFDAMMNTGQSDSIPQNKADAQQAEASQKKIAQQNANAGNSKAPRSRAPDPGNYRGRFNAERASQGKSRLPDDFDAHHRIPQEYRSHPDFKDFDFDAPNNIQGIQGSRSSTNHHQNVTNDWAKFKLENPKASGKNIRDFAEKIDTKYEKNWFK